MFIRFRNSEKLKKKLKKFLDKDNWSDKVEEMLGIIGEDAVKNIGIQLRVSDLKTIDKLVRKLKFEVSRRKLRVSLPVSYAPFLNYGTAPRQMIELEGKVIPMIIGDRLIFRTASRQSMAKGHWKHPGIAPRRFWERGLITTLETAKKEIMKLPKGVFK